MQFLLGLIVGLFAGVLWAWGQGANPWPAWAILAAVVLAGSAGIVIGSLVAARARRPIDYIPADTEQHIQVWPIQGGHALCVKRPIRESARTAGH